MKFYNTLTKSKEEFIPLEEGKVRMYVCCPTVYNLIHIGNARPMIVFDTLRRYMEYKGYEVNYVSNFTDVDDKIIAAALESRYSRIPIYDGRIDNIVGILQVNHLLRELMDGRKPDISELITEVEFVPQTKKLPNVLEQLRQHKNHMAVVTDEYGGTFGIITMEDILEELVGDIWDETDEIDPDITEVSENGFLMDGTMMLSDFLEYIEVEDEEFEEE